MAELGETTDPRELVEGDPAAVDRNVQTLRTRGERAGEAADGLLSIDTGAWTGEAADAFHDSFEPKPKQWNAAADALDAAATTLGEYAGMLRWAQERAGRAVDLYEQGQRATQQARAQHDAEAQQNPPPDGGEPAPFVDPGEEQRQSARDMLNRARQQLHEAGSTSAQVLREQTPPETESTFSTIAHGALDIAGFFPLIGNAADLTNAAWYGLQGKGVDATLSAAAAIPVAGWASGGIRVGKWGERVGGTDEAVDAWKATDKAVSAGKAGRNVYAPVRRRVKLRAGTKRAVIRDADRTREGDFICPGSDKTIPAQRKNGELVRVNPDTGKPDPNGMTVPEKGSFDFAHQEGAEWWRYKQQAEANQYSRRQVIEDQNNPQIYQIQDRSYNRSREGEAPP